MIVAMVSVHLKGGFFASTNGIEFNIPFLICLIRVNLSVDETLDQAA